MDMSISKTITVFGSSKPVASDVDYQFAYELGRTLAGTGYNVANGGYSGTMAAVSEGASAFPVEIVGVTCSAFGRNGPNKWLTSNILTQNLNERLMKLVELGDAYIALPGGTGTLLEIAMVWEMINKKFIKPRPFILIGESWKRVAHEVVLQDSDSAQYINCLDSIEQVIAFFNENNLS